MWATIENPKVLIAGANPTAEKEKRMYESWYHRALQDPQAEALDNYYDALIALEKQFEGSGKLKYLTRKAIADREFVSSHGNLQRAYELSLQNYFDADFERTKLEEESLLFRIALISYKLGDNWTCRMILNLNKSLGVGVRQSTYRKLLQDCNCPSKNTVEMNVIPEYNATFSAKFQSFVKSPIISFKETIESCICTRVGQAQSSHKSFELLQLFDSHYFSQNNMSEETLQTHTEYVPFAESSSKLKSLVAEDSSSSGIDLLSMEYLQFLSEIESIHNNSINVNSTGKFSRVFPRQNQLEIIKIPRRCIDCITGCLRDVETYENVIVFALEVLIDTLITDIFNGNQLIFDMSCDNIFCLYHIVDSWKIETLLCDKNAKHSDITIRKLWVWLWLDIFSHLNQDRNSVVDEFFFHREDLVDAVIAHLDEYCRQDHSMTSMVESPGCGNIGNVLVGNLEYCRQLKVDIQLLNQLSNTLNNSFQSQYPENEDSEGMREIGLDKLMHIIEFSEIPNLSSSIVNIIVTLLDSKKDLSIADQFMIISKVFDKLIKFSKIDLQVNHQLLSSWSHLFDRVLCDSMSYQRHLDDNDEFNMMLTSKLSDILDQLVHLYYVAVLVCDQFVMEVVLNNIRVISRLFSEDTSRNIGLFVKSFKLIHKCLLAPLVIPNTLNRDTCTAILNCISDIFYNKYVINYIQSDCGFDYFNNIVKSNVYEDSKSLISQLIRRFVCFGVKSIQRLYNTEVFVLSNYFLLKPSFRDGNEIMNAIDFLHSNLFYNQLYKIVNVQYLLYLISWRVIATIDSLDYIELDVINYSASELPTAANKASTLSNINPSGNLSTQTTSISSTPSFNASNNASKSIVFSSSDTKKCIVHIPQYIELTMQLGLFNFDCERENGNDTDNDSDNGNINTNSENSAADGMRSETTRRKVPISLRDIPYIYCLLHSIIEEKELHFIVDRKLREFPAMLLHLLHNYEIYYRREQSEPENTDNYYQRVNSLCDGHAKISSINICNDIKKQMFRFGGPNQSTGTTFVQNSFNNNYSHREFNSYVQDNLHELLAIFSSPEIETQKLVSQTIVILTLVLTYLGENENYNMEKYIQNIEAVDGIEPGRSNSVYRASRDSTPIFKEKKHLHMLHNLLHYMSPYTMHVSYITLVLNELSSVLRIISDDINMMVSHPELPNYFMYLQASTNEDFDLYRFICNEVYGRLCICESDATVNVSISEHIPNNAPMSSGQSHSENDEYLVRNTPYTYWNNFKDVNIQMKKALYIFDRKATGFSAEIKFELLSLFTFYNAMKVLFERFTTLLFAIVENQSRVTVGDTSARNSSFYNQVLSDFCVGKMLTLHFPQKLGPNERNPTHTDGVNSDNLGNVNNALDPLDPIHVLRNACDGTGGHSDSIPKIESLTDISIDLSLEYYLWALEFPENSQERKYFKLLACKLSQLCGEQDENCFILQAKVIASHDSKVRKNFQYKSNALELHPVRNRSLDVILQSNTLTCKELQYLRHLPEVNNISNNRQQFNPEDRSESQKILFYDSNNTCLQLYLSAIQTSFARISRKQKSPNINNKYSYYSFLAKFCLAKLELAFSGDSGDNIIKATIEMKNNCIIDEVNNTYHKLHNSTPINYSQNRDSGVTNGIYSIPLDFFYGNIVNAIKNLRDMRRQNTAENLTIYRVTDIIYKLVLLKEKYGIDYPEYFVHMLRSNGIQDISMRSAFHEIHKLFDKLKPQLLNVWKNNSSNAIDKMLLANVKFNKLRQKYILKFMELSLIVDNFNTLLDILAYVQCFKRSFHFIEKWFVNNVTHLFCNAAICGEIDLLQYVSNSKAIVFKKLLQNNRHCISPENITNLIKTVARIEVLKAELNKATTEIANMKAEDIAMRALINAEIEATKSLMHKEASIETTISTDHEGSVLTGNIQGQSTQESLDIIAKAGDIMEMSDDSFVGLASQGDNWLTQQSMEQDSQGDGTVVREISSSTNDSVVEIMIESESGHKRSIDELQGPESSTKREKRVYFVG